MCIRDRKNAEREAAEKKIAGLQQQITICRKRLEDGQTAYHREASRLESLQNLAERYDGYGGSIRKVMERKNQEQGICGVVADLIQTEKTYETAVSYTHLASCTADGTVRICMCGSAVPRRI